MKQGCGWYLDGCLKELTGFASFMRGSPADSDGH
jgi:hypothetical protein